MKKERIIVIIILLIVVSIIAYTSYAYYTIDANLGDSNATISTKELEVEFSDDNVIDVSGILPGATIIKQFSVSNTGTDSVSYGLAFYDVINNLENKNDLVYTLSSTNNGGVVSSSTLFPTQDGFLINNINIDDGVTQEYTLTISYLNQSYDQSIDMNKLATATIKLVDVNTSFIEVICKKATNLHTETCNNTGCTNAGYTNGSTITYGSIANGSNLTTGNALDCDVNDDGTYDSDTERFYYVNTNNGVANLIYSNNLVLGEIDNVSEGRFYDYTSNDSDPQFWTNGPVYPRQDLPTTEQWPNVSLTSTNRTIYSYSNIGTQDYGEISVNFSYEGYSARLLAINDIYNITNLTSHSFFFENTVYAQAGVNNGYWLEDELKVYSNRAWHTYGGTPSFVNRGHAYNIIKEDRVQKYGTRPVIEVPVINIALN